jgi:hypothetical protein
MSKLHQLRRNNRDRLLTLLTAVLTLIAVTLGIVVARSPLWRSARCRI